MADEQFEQLAAWADENGIGSAGGPAVESEAPSPDTPSAWFARRCPGLEEEFGRAVEEVYPEGEEGGKPWVKDLSEDFLAATLGMKGSPAAPTVYVAPEARFYTYSPAEGIYIEAREAKLTAGLSAMLLECSRACAGRFDTRSLGFRFRDSASLRGVLDRARGLHEVDSRFFETDLMEYVPCSNGMLRVSDRRLLAFGPEYRRRNKLAVPYTPGATCPLFLNTLLLPALDAEDIDLLQRWCGLALIGVNLAQRFVILTGTAGGGKGTLVRVVTAIVGANNVGMLRPDLLGERFELGRLLGKSLLYGADVPENFLNCKGASTLKALTGGDPVTLELKGSNERPQIICRFNAIVTCNSRLTVHLEGDAEAWRRRLAIIQFAKAKPERVIADLSEQILREEGPGVLNWMLAGVEVLRADGWQLRLSDGQQRRVDDLLMESEADAVFAKECLFRDGTESLTVTECYEAYVDFCSARGWTLMPKRKFSASIADTVTREFGLTLRHDIAIGEEKPQRGWKGLGCK